MKKLTFRIAGVFMAVAMNTSLVFAQTPASADNNSEGSSPNATKVPTPPVTSSGQTEADRGQGASAANTASDGTSGTRVNGGKDVLQPHPPTPSYPTQTRSYSSSLPDNGGVPPTVTMKTPLRDGASSSTLPETGQTPPVVTSKVPSRDLGASSTLPDNGGIPPVVTTKTPSRDLGASSTLPETGKVPPVVTAKVPSHDLGYSSTLPENGGVPPVVAPKNPEGAPTYPPSVPHQ